MAVPGLTTAQQGYGGRHQRRRALLAPLVAAGSVTCARCGKPIGPGEPWDLGHVDGDRQRYSGPEHRSCNRSTAGRPWQKHEPVEPRPEPKGLSAADERWRVPWLESLLKVPRTATWPRLMTVPHPRAAGSLGPDFLAFAEKRKDGRPLWWWQKLAATRLLEVDGNGELVWRVGLLTIARQIGKSWLLRELLLWRMHQGERFGERQTIMHTGNNITICGEVQRDARLWARDFPDDYKVLERYGRQSIERLADHSEWVVSSKAGVYGTTVSLGAVDEAWDVPSTAVDEGLTPTMVQRSQPQLYLVSTAHRLARDLMIDRRMLALEELEAGTGDLLMEWSAPHEAGVDDREGWRLASPQWTKQREQQLERELYRLLAGEQRDDGEPDPEQSFRSQWLNQWPRELVKRSGVGLLRPGEWEALEQQPAGPAGPLYVAVEDDFGHGAAVGVASMLEDGRIEVDGELCADWDSALDYVARLSDWREVRDLQVGASMLASVPPDVTARAAGSRETKVALALLRDLVTNGMVVHWQTPDLDQAVRSARVREAATGLYLLEDCPRHLIHAVVWALLAAAQPAPEPAIY
jgi:hypothetical protein